MKKLSRIFLFIAVLLVFVYVAGGQKLFRSLTESKKEYQYISLFSEVVSLIRAEYVESVDPSGKFPGAYSSMLKNLHQTAAYLGKKETVLYNLYRQTRVCGTGIYGGESAGYFVVTNVLPGSPAEIAGIKPGVLIKAVDGKTIFGLSPWCMFLSMFSQKPGKLEMVVLEEGSTRPSRILVQTAVNEFAPALSTEKIQADILKVSLTRIDLKTAAALKTILEKESASGVSPRLILDLRNYNGGVLEGFTEMTRLLVREPLELQVKTREKQEILQLGSPQAIAGEAAVIIDGSTIMYGELLAAALKSRKAKTTLLGLPTNGFVSKLSHIALEDGSSILIPEAVLKIDKNNSVQDGLEPDIKIKLKDSATIFKRSISILTNDSNQKKTQ